jgi:hypothetical protein
LKTPITTIRIPLELKQKFKEAAKKRYMTLTAWLIKAGIDKLKQEGKKAKFKIDVLTASERIAASDESKHKTI